MGGEGRLLVVSDDPVFAVTLDDAMRARGWTTIVAPMGHANAARTLAALARPSPPEDSTVHVVVIDMADGDDDFERAARASRTRDSVPTIVVSAACSSLPPARREALGFAAYVGKPFSAPEMIALIELVAREASRSVLASGVVPTVQLTPRSRTA